MQAYISILRGINVGGKKSVKMDVLRKIYVDLGFQNVQTYIQSGNVVFCSENSSKQDLATKITEKILETFAFDVPIIILTLHELQEIIKNNPFLVEILENNQKENLQENQEENQKDSQKDRIYFHITFLSEIPEKALFDKIKENIYQKDEFLLLGKSIYLYCPDGYGNSKLTNGFFETKLKVIATTRNWKTSLELLNMAEKISNSN